MGRLPAFRCCDACDVIAFGIQRRSASWTFHLALPLTSQGFFSPSRRGAEPVISVMLCDVFLMAGTPPFFKIAPLVLSSVCDVGAVCTVY
ncbi:hypothetical protein FKM82_018176 [Ascaphus truei]